MNDPIHPSPLVPVPLYPRTFGQTLDRIFELLRKRFRLLVGIASVPAGAMFVLYLLLLVPFFLLSPPFNSNRPPNPEAFVWIIFPIVLAGWIPILAVMALYEAAISYAATQADLGIEVSWRDCYRRAWSKAGRYLWLMILRMLYVVVPILVVAGLIALAVFSLVKLDGAGTTPAGAFVAFPIVVLLYLGAMVYAIFMMMRLSLAYPACIMEDLTASAAIQRTVLLTKGAKGRIFLVTLIIYAMSYVLEIALFAVFGVVFFIGALVFAAFHGQVRSALGVAGIGLTGICVCGALFVWFALMLAAYSTGFAVLYNDQRVRREGYDIVRMMEAAGLHPPQTPPAGESPVEFGQPEEPKE